MPQEYDPSIRLNQYGQVDADYYVQKAHDARSEAMAEMLTAIKAWIKTKVTFERIPTQQTLFGH